jgi:hypothetical protein
MPFTVEESRLFARLFRVCLVLLLIGAGVLAALLIVWIL